MRELTTMEAAAKAGIGRATLQRWITEGRIRAPRAVVRKGHAVRLWTPADIGRLKEVKKRTYWKGRGKKKVTEA